jgi:hypothetical protein
MKRKTWTILCFALAVLVSTLGFAQEGSREYFLLGRMEGSSCPVCDNYVRDVIWGTMTLEALPVACHNCTAYRVVSLGARGEIYKVELGKDGGIIRFNYGDPVAYISLNLLVNGIEVPLTDTGKYWLGKRVWPLCYFPDLSSGWFSLGFAGFPLRR